MKFILYLLKGFRFARKRLGGKWYLIHIIDSGSGIAGSIQYWTQSAPVDDETEIIEIETY